MNYIDFNKRIKEDDINSVYLFTGSEEYIMNKYIDRLIDLYVGESLKDLNYIEITKENTFEDLFNACETLPFMSKRKMVLVKDLEEFIKIDKSNSEKLTDYIGNISEDSLLILKDKNSNLRKNTRLYKGIDKLGGVVNFERLNNKQLRTWILKYLDEKGKKISNSDLNYFINNTGYLEYRSEKTLFQLENDLVKVIGHSEDDYITREDIESNLIKDLDTNVFNLIDFINSGNDGRALELLDEMYRANEPLGRVFFMIIRNMRLQLQYKTYSARGYNDSESRNKMKISPYEFKNIAKSSRAYSEEELSKILTYLLEEDRKQKTSSQNEKLAMEMMIIKIINRNI